MTALADDRLFFSGDKVAIYRRGELECLANVDSAGVNEAVVHFEMAGSAVELRVSQETGDDLDEHARGEGLRAVLADNPVTEAELEAIRLIDDYLMGRSGGFFTKLVDAMSSADSKNLRQLHGAFPYLVDAWMRYRHDSGFAERWRIGSPADGDEAEEAGGTRAVPGGLRSGWVAPDEVLEGVRSELEWGGVSVSTDAKADLSRRGSSDTTGTVVVGGEVPEPASEPVFGTEELPF